MAKNSGGGDAVQGYVFLFAAIAMCLFESTRTFGLSILFVIVTFVVVMFFWADASLKKEAAALASAEQKIKNLVEEHLETLANRHDTLVRVDRYGVVDGADWNKEVQHFADKVVRPALTDSEAQSLANAGLSTVMQRHLEEQVARYCEHREGVNTIADDTSPIDFEGMCAAALRRAGWNASTTKGSGDQGADVVADLAGTKLVLQCKLYTGNVGNKAVQEVIAAKHFYSADLAAVVCKTEYSKSAKILAKTAQVEILSYSELEAYAERTATVLRGSVTPMYS